MGLGVWDGSKTDEVGSVHVSTTNIVIHDDYNSNTFANDIALIYLPEEVTLTDKIRTVCLPPKGINVDGENVVGNLKEINVDCDIGAKPLWNFHNSRSSLYHI